MRFKKILLSLISTFLLFQAPIFAQESGVDEQHPLVETPVHYLAGESVSSRDVQGYLNYLLGGYYPSGYCMKFIADVFEDLGLRRSSACCAQHYADLFKQSDSRQDIPVGADVFFSNIGGGPCIYCKSSSYGHIGIYVGNNRFIHSDNGKVQISSLNDPFFSAHFSGWGMHGGMIADDTEINCNPASSVLYKVEANGYPLLMRSNPSKDGQILARIPDQSVVNVSRNHGGWAHVSYNGISGYASLDYLKPVNRSVSFNDLGTDHWANGYVQKMVLSGMMSVKSGNSFQPDAPVSLAEALGIAKQVCANPQDSNQLYTVKTVQKNGKDKPEADVINFSSKYPTIAKRSDRQVIEWALCRNIISENEVSKLDLSITKADLASIITKVLEYKGVYLRKLNGQTATWLALQDPPELDTKGVYLNQCFNAGILSGNENGFLNADSMLTRAQAAKMFWQAYIY